jgi:hypothetical protein
MDELVFQHSYLTALIQHSNCGIIVDIAVLSSFLITKRDRYFVFKTATTENPVSHKYVVTNGKKISKAFFLKT